MSDDLFGQVLKLTEDKKVELGDEMRELLHTELALGMTRYQCRYGTLGVGHEKLTDPQRYYQSLREIYNRAISLRAQKAVALQAQADLIDAENELKWSFKKSTKLRAEAKRMNAIGSLQNSLVNAEDLLRQLDEFNKVRLELKDMVRTKYPLGIEQAEEDNWKAVAEYRAKMRKIGYDNQPQHIPLEPHIQAEIGLKWDVPELALMLESSEKTAVDALGGVRNYMGLRDEQLKKLADYRK